VKEVAMGNVLRPEMPTDATSGDDTSAFVGRAMTSRWGIAAVPWLWGTRVKVLFVIDGRVSVGDGDEEFGLGLVLSALRDRSFAWWVRFDVDVVCRDARPDLHDNFRFTEDGFDIDEFDQVWFFGDLPGVVANDPAVGDNIITEAENAPLSNGELRVIAEWMERGGGVFAAGDHSLLGASMCHRIPRVRTMRKWTRAQEVPSFSGADRNETLQHTLGGGFGSWEGDRSPQPIVPVYHRDATMLFGHERFPHPLLCGDEGVIDRFPDHMHEGAVFEDEDVVLDRDLGIPGYEGVEYPIVPLEAEPNLGPVAGPFGFQPRPRVIAHGLTTHIEQFPRPFALIGTYDGDPANIGRVVVDSTWHHWFSMNLVGFRDGAPDVYRGMQTYYRNVGLWLSTPAQRASMLFAATWGVLVGKQPGLFSHQLSIWDIGARVVDVIGQTAPQCILSDLVAPFLTTLRNRQMASRRRSPQAASLPPLDLMLNQAIVGGIALQFVDMAHHNVLEQARGRPSTIDDDAIEARGLAGVEDAQRELMAVFAEGASDLTAVHESFAADLGRMSIGSIPIDIDTVEPSPANG
jgi:hypothetical protein